MPTTIEIPSSLTEAIQSVLPRSGCKDAKEFVVSAIKAHLVSLRNHRKVIESHPELEQGSHLLKAGNLEADILKDDSAQLMWSEIDTMVRPKSNAEVDKLIALYLWN